ncbi:Hypothetical protein SMAX5B_013312 [Scophthalmus maximus]|uniref:Uncharacterized protein n=1 Tax=Scophthalmus maximus TaxID=52904 RepID=A0A2U9B5M6_SCOMX|nr:Hypothetical protein SMAX5B_013312 [Scophthalmus maximus]
MAQYVTTPSPGPLRGSGLLEESPQAINQPKLQDKVERPLNQVVMVGTVEALGAFSLELDRKLPKEVQGAISYHREYLLFLRQAFQEELVVAWERKLPKCQVWVCLDFTKVDWCQDKGLVDVEFCQGCQRALT